MAMDPLATSTFALLDKHSSLRLVTDAMHEDDALCLVLTCRALRDILWARFPWWPTGDAHASAQVRPHGVVVVGTVRRLVWARGLNRSWPGPRAYWRPNQICETATWHGALASLQWVRANGCRGGLSTCRATTEGGQPIAL
jgi:hypothetical protein